MTISLYVHIPFCLKRCIYCDFVSEIYSSEKEAQYITALKKEIHNISYGNYPSPIPLPDASGEGVRGRVFSTLYIGGGTPTVLSTDALSELITYIFKRLKFAEDYEATIEANPGTLDKDKLQAIRSSGVNRISIGIQSFNNKDLAFLGRVHTGEEAEQTVLLARDAGFENIGIDLIYGIPGQDVKTWRKTLEKAVSLKPKHISTYELTVEKGTLLWEYMKADPHAACHPEFISGSKEMLNQVQHDKKKKSSKQHKPIPLDEDEIIKMYEYTIDYLTSEGFIHYEISNFAMPDYFCRHNLNYWDRGEYYGVGLGAHSFAGGRRYCNTANIDDYISRCLGTENNSTVKEEEELTDGKALSEAIFLGMRNTAGVDFRALSEKFGKDTFKLYKKEIEDLKQDGLIEFDLTGNLIKLTRKGLLLSNEVFIKFM